MYIIILHYSDFYEDRQQVNNKKQQSDEGNVFFSLLNKKSLERTQEVSTAELPEIKSHFWGFALLLCFHLQQSNSTVIS